MNQHTWGKWLIHRTKYDKDNQFQSLESYDESFRCETVANFEKHGYEV